MLDVESGRLAELRSGDGEYYGVTWSSSAVFVGHSRIDNEGLLTHEDVLATGRGDAVGYDAEGRTVARTPKRLLLAHQMEWVNDRLLVVDTGRERLSIYAAEGSLVGDVALGDLGWDRGPGGQVGHHFNSVHRDRDRVWIVAHNHGRPAELWELSWPDLEIVQVHVTDATWAHNVWDGDAGLVTCDSGAGTLHEVRSNRAIWRATEDGAITRGLAVGADYVFVGHSEYGGRGERRSNDGGLWLLDRKTLTTIEKIQFRGSGCVNEIRLLDGHDECHNGEPFDDRLLGGLARIGAGGDEVAWGGRVAV